MLAADPSAILDVPDELFIGENVNFTVAFDNAAMSPGNVGYGPLIDLVFPLNGADGNSGGLPKDGIDFLNATYLGIRLQL